MGFPVESIPHERVIDALRLALLEDFMANLNRGFIHPLEIKGPILVAVKDGELESPAQCSRDLSS
jgi:hypothetical protein